MSALGERFRAAREARGLSLSDVAEQIRIRSVYLAAIEDENWNAIGAPVYTRGFLRTYARFLGLESEEVIADFNAATETVPGIAAAPGKASAYLEESSSRSAMLSPLLWVASIVAVVLIAFVFYNELTMRDRAPQGENLSASPSASMVAQAVVSAQDATPTAPSPSPDASAATTNALQVRLSAASWIRVTVDGSVSMEGTFSAGTARSFHGKIAVLRIGNAGGVEVLVDGKDVGKLGATGDVVERRFIL